MAHESGRTASDTGVVSVLLAALGCLPQSGCERKTEVAAGAPSSAAPAAGERAARPGPGTTAPSPSLRGRPRLVGGKPTGYSEVADGLVIRTTKQACPSERPRLEECRSSKRRCVKDAECEAKPNGHCTDLGDGLGCGCQYGCVDDGDCGKDQVCLCGDPVGTCVDVSCTPESCAAPSQCASYHDGCSYAPFACIERAGSRTCTF